ncbi:monovalent cation/H(+) antiporter subunit G [Gluconacetobacter takamatsuzukensis]|uniref:Cation:proton antiporter n=1 Tax=Gluconacetobacter takamatsuzukensis TaxID=1286190 RepID=A0A7W4KFQ3_9PROT|nr:monovalent cation/H(+) antiporter subunit G [Gluconacetobacter takamatsuzukensis]MBB2206119.1 cation:proton antiporter [Gluconacetobacter takamatsuzukensis]
MLVIVAWLAVFGFLRLRETLDALHAVAFLNVAGSIMLTLVCVTVDGLSTRTIKCALVALLFVFGGAVVSLMIGRAYLHRVAEEERP